MNVNISYYGHSVDVDEEGIAGDLPDDATEDQITRAVNDDIEAALQEDPGSYRNDAEDVVDRIKELLAERRANPE